MQHTDSVCITLIKGLWDTQTKKMLFHIAASRESEGRRALHNSVYTSTGGSLVLSVLPFGESQNRSDPKYYTQHKITLKHYPY